MLAAPACYRRSPCRWALVLLAWLLLVMNTAQVATCAPMAGYDAGLAMHAAPRPAMGFVGDACRHGSEGAARLHCDCPAMCSPALLPVPALILARGLPAIQPAGIARPDAPQPARTPPLRPPQA